MNLPTIFNIAIGLIFIYLVLSLLASQIQEVIATILEWRAEQLTRAIENLVLGDTDIESPNTKKTYELVDKLFRNPLIRNLNQTSKSWGTRKIITQNKENRKTINPTYIPAETFSSTILSELDIPKAARVLTWLNAKRLIHYEIYNKIDKLLESVKTTQTETDNTNQAESGKITQQQKNVIETHYEELKKCLNDVLDDYKMERYGLSSTLIRLRTQIGTFKREVEECFPVEESSQPKDNDFSQASKSLKNPIDKIIDFIFTTDKNDSDLVTRLRPSLTTILDLLIPPYTSEQAIDFIFTSEKNNDKDIPTRPILTKFRNLFETSNTSKNKLLKTLNIFQNRLSKNKKDEIINFIFQPRENNYSLGASDRKYFSTLLELLVSPHTSKNSKLDAYQNFKSQLRDKSEQANKLKPPISLKNADDLYQSFTDIEKYFSSIDIEKSFESSPLAYKSFQEELKKQEDLKKSKDEKNSDLKDPEINDLYVSFTYAQEYFNKISYLLPESLRKSLYELALRSRIKALDVEQQLDGFKQEIETWFDRSMDRASGVYKRNARGFAFLIGFVLAVTLNADTFYIISRLAKDDALRNSIVSTSTKLVESEQSSNPSPTASPSPTPISSSPASPSPTVSPLSADKSSSPASPSPTPTLSPNVIDRVKDKVDQSLSEITLPIGWTDNILEEQLQRDIPSKEGETAEQKQNREIQNEKRKIELAPRRTKIFGRYVVPPEAIMIMGWLVTATAIMMGAPFWFDFLGLFINVRNTGAKPKSKTNKN